MAGEFGILNFIRPVAKCAWRVHFTKDVCIAHPRGIVLARRCLIRKGSLYDYVDPALHGVDGSVHGFSAVAFN